MKHCNTTLLYVLAILFLPLVASSQNFSWVKHVSSIENDAVNDFVFDSQGNIILTGTYKNSAIILGNDTLPSHGKNDVFVSKVDPNGNFIWSIDLGGSGIEKPSGIAVDANDNIYVVGSFYNMSTFGPYTLSSKGGTDIFIVKLDNSGNVLWAKQHGGSSSSSPSSVKVKGNYMYVTGDYLTSLQIGPFSFGSQSYDIFVAKFDLNGNPIWAKVGGGVDQDFAQDIVLDDSDNVYITGEIEGSIVVFDNKSVNTYGTNGSTDAFVAKYDSSGSIQWLINAGSSLDDQGTGLLYHDGKIYLAGYYTYQATFGTFAFNAIGSWDAYLAVIDASSGNFDQVYPVASSGSDYGSAVSVDPLGNIYFTGHFHSSVNIGGNFVSSGGKSDIFVTKLNNSGAFEWAISAGGTGYDSPKAMLNDNLGNIYIGGAFDETTYFPGVGQFAVHAQSFNTGVDDGFITRINNQVVTDITENIQETIQLYPNPTNGFINIDGLNRSDTYQIKIHNALGALVYQNNVTENNSQINLKNLDKGLYTVQILNDNTNYIKQVLIH